MKILRNIKQVLCLILCVIILISTIIPASAKNDDNDNFYTLNRDSLEEIYDGTLSDIMPDKVLGWLTDNKSFVVVRKYKDRRDNDKEKTKVYVNVPNVQQYLQSEVLNILDEGYDSVMYTPSSKLIDEVGKNQDNVINKFGFNIPVNKYNGEYPRIYMSMTNILPTKWYQKIWRGIKSLFGYSLIKAPDADNYKTLGYWGNEYYDSDREKIIQFVMDNWTTFESYLWSNSSYYFVNAEDYNKKKKKEKDYNDAHSWLKTNAAALAEAHAVKDAHDYWTENYSTSEAFLATSEGADYTALVAESIAQSIVYAAWQVESAISPVPLPMPPIPTIPPDWETYRDEVRPEPPEPTAEQLSLINQEPTKRKTVANYLDYAVRMNNGTYRVTGDDHKIGHADSIDLDCLAANGLAYDLDPATSNGVGIDDKDKKNMYYSQCLLKKKSNDDETVDEEKCIKTINGQEYFVTISELYIESGAWKISNDARKKGTLQNGNVSRQDAVKIIEKISNYLGPAYSEGMSYFIAVYLMCAEENGQSLHDIYETYIDPRVMPYDIDSLAFKSDKEAITVADPRTEIYKNSNLIGGIVTSWRWNILNQLVNYNSLAKFIINLGGKISTISVFFNQVSNFQYIDSVGLNPTTMWGFISYVLIMSLLMCVFLVHLIKKTIQFLHGKAGIVQIFKLLLGFALLSGIIVMLITKPDSTWNTFLNVFNKVNNIGEDSVMSTMNGINELYGSDNKRDSSVNYYIPYFNLWTLYNTGYNLNDPQQRINIDDGTPEVSGFDTDVAGKETQYYYDVEINILNRTSNMAKDLYPSGVTTIRPKINGTPTKLWSVVLADSFNKIGYNQNTSFYNMFNINPNAYRVVDHFIAPRLTSSNPSNTDLDITNTMNENYNGDFQAVSVFSLLGGLLAIVNTFLLSLIKLLTFFWLWWMLYMFVINIVLGSVNVGSFNINNSRKGVLSILIKTFSPMLFLILIGLYTGLVIQITMYSSGVVNLVLNIGLLIVTAKLITAWSNTSVFPGTLKPLKAILHPILTITGFNNTRAQRNLDYLAEQHNIQKDENGEYREEDFITQQGTLLNDTEERHDLNEAYREQIYQKYRADMTLSSMSSAERAFFLRDEELQYAKDHNKLTIKESNKQREKENNKKRKLSKSRRVSRIDEDDEE